MEIAHDREPERLQRGDRTEGRARDPHHGDRRAEDPLHVVERLDRVLAQLHVRAAAHAVSEVERHLVPLHVDRAHHLVHGRLGPVLLKHVPWHQKRALGVVLSQQVHQLSKLRVRAPRARKVFDHERDAPGRAAPKDVVRQKLLSKTTRERGLQTVHDPFGAPERRVGHADSLARLNSCAYGSGSRCDEAVCRTW